jgi:hypothetical protein
MRMSIEKYQEILDLFGKVESELGHETISDSFELEILHGMLKKLIQQAHTANYLFEGTKTKITNSFIDTSTIMNVARSIIETYAELYHLVFSNKESPQRLDFRRLYYQFMGYYSRDKILALEPSSQDVQNLIRHYQTELTQLETNLRNNQEFKTKYPTLDKVTRFFAKPFNFPIEKVITRIEMANWGKSTAKAAYSFLSGYAHSDYSSNRDIATNDDASVLEASFALFGLQFISISLSLLIIELAKKYPTINEFLQNKPQETKTVLYFSSLSYRNDDREVQALLEYIDSKSYKVISWNTKSPQGQTILIDTQEIEAARNEFIRNSQTSDQGYYEIPKGQNVQQLFIF